MNHRLSARQNRLIPISGTIIVISGTDKNNVDAYNAPSPVTLDALLCNKQINDANKTRVIHCVTFRTLSADSREGKRFHTHTQRTRRDRCSRAKCTQYDALFEKRLTNCTEQSQ